jgi:farnesyl diphosphate synthase
MTETAGKPAAAEAVEAALERLLPDSDAPHGRVVEAMRYAALGGGKRMRAFLVLASAGLFNVPPEQALRVAAALEMVHAYSLVHDDLPAMDDDDLRRGRPSVHVAFDEATAILAGDGLLTRSFEVLAGEETHPDAVIRCRLVAALARAAGADGMVGGQMIDLAGLAGSGDLCAITLLQEMKTGALILFAVEAGGILGGASDEEMEALRLYGREVGLAFQIADDILDVEGETAQMGKRTGKDAGRGKATFVAALGLEEAKKRAAALVDAACKRLDLFGRRADPLKEIAGFAVSRRA